jgi:hypothetical protein
LLRKVGDVSFPSTIYLTDMRADASGDPALHRLAQRENNLPQRKMAEKSNVDFDTTRIVDAH